MVKITKHFSNTVDGTNGAFMGFDTSESDDTDTSDVEQGSCLLDDVSKTLADDDVLLNILRSLSNFEYHMCTYICAPD
jgi:hypothetical protein